MSDPTYRIGPSDLFTGGDLDADANTLDGQVTALDLASDGNENVSEDLFTTWDLWKLRWRAYRSDTYGGFLSDTVAAFNNGNRDQLIAYEKEFIGFANQFAAAGVILPGPLVQPSSGSQDGLFDHLKKALGFDVESLVIGLVVVLLGAYLVKRAV